MATCMNQNTFKTQNTLMRDRGQSSLLLTWADVEIYFSQKRTISLFLKNVSKNELSEDRQNLQFYLFQVSRQHCWCHIIAAPFTIVLILLPYGNPCRFCHILPTLWDWKATFAEKPLGSSNHMHQFSFSDNSWCRWRVWKLVYFPYWTNRWRRFGQWQAPTHRNAFASYG